MAQDGGRCALHGGEIAAPPGRPYAGNTETPGRFSDEELATVERLAPAFGNIRLVADYFGMAERTFRKRMEEDPRVAAAYARGRARAIGAGGLALFAEAFRYDEPRQRYVVANPDLAKFYMLSQGGWSQKQQYEVSGPEGGPIEIMPAIEAARERLREQMKRLRDQPEEIEAEVETSESLSPSNGRPSENGSHG